MRFELRPNSWVRFHLKNRSVCVEMYAAETECAKAKEQERAWAFKEGKSHLYCLWCVDKEERTPTNDKMVGRRFFRTNTYIVDKG